MFCLYVLIQIVIHIFQFSLLLHLNQFYDQPDRPSWTTSICTASPVTVGSPTRSLRAGTDYLLYAPYQQDTPWPAESTVTYHNSHLHYRTSFDSRPSWSRLACCQAPPQTWCTSPFCSTAPPRPAPGPC